MIGCTCDGRTLLLLPKDFRELRGRLVSGLDEKEQLWFAMAVLHNTAPRAEQKKYPKWERQFVQRLVREIETGTFDPAYHFTTGDAQMHIADYLEAYRASFRCINVAVGDLYNGCVHVFNVSLRAKQSLLDRLLRRLGHVVGEINFLRSDVTRIDGTSLNFTLNVDGITYRFAPEGISRV